MRRFFAGRKREIMSGRYPGYLSGRVANVAYFIAGKRGLDRSALKAMESQVIMNLLDDGFGGRIQLKPRMQSWLSADSLPLRKREIFFPWLRR
jgi:hypothetical protein